MRKNQQMPKMKFEGPISALERFNPFIKSASNTSDETTINIYDSIGENWEGTGMTPKIVSSILRKADGRDVTVNINSPGGDFFDGLAIHTLLSEYPGKVHVRVLGMAASAASVIAMAGDKIEIAESAFFMIHNAWTIAIGNRNDMQDVSDMLGQFDQSMVQLYAKKTGMSEKEIAKMMDAETWINGKKSVEQNFASGLLGVSEIDVDEQANSEYNATLRKVDVNLARAGMPRSERRSLLKELTSTPCAADEPMPCAGEDSEFSNALASLMQTTTNLLKDS